MGIIILLALFFSLGPCFAPLAPWSLLPPEPLYSYIYSRNLVSQHYSVCSILLEYATLMARTAFGTWDWEMGVRYHAPCICCCQVRGAATDI
ncbi:hypothetical protein N656DRAFT_251267 [Canariomyces notabilis]|uniref:Secreted protein n=1 Tax=Canariomyces notabilis TaxID=2074819 RepID=A0AAN6TL05_9PEZI|nr:hypothetical protein N656DRAFT_251267 [Canariomyces arenarius]